MIINDKEKLEIKCKPCSSVEEGEEIAIKLFTELANSKTPGIGLAANQIGINKRVCVINVKEPIILINPTIVEYSKQKFAFLEGCLSFGIESVKTSRYKWVRVKADNHTSEILFTVEDLDSYDKQDRLNYALECACVQHEIDHLDGITMFDREIEPFIAKSNKIGRNDKVTISQGNKSKVVKYKKALPLLGDGWTLVGQ